MFTLSKLVNSKHFFMSFQREYENIINSKISQIEEESHSTYMNRLCSFCKNNSFLQCSEFSTLCFVKTQFGWTHDTILGFSFSSKDKREITKDIEQSSQSHSQRWNKGLQNHDFTDETALKFLSFLSYVLVYEQQKWVLFLPPLWCVKRRPRGAMWKMFLLLFVGYPLLNFWGLYAFY